MFRGKSCAVEKRGTNSYIYKDAFNIHVKNGRDLAALVEAQLLQAKNRVADLEKLKELMQVELGQAEPVTQVRPRKFPTGASGAADRHPDSPAPVEIKEKRRPDPVTGRAERTAEPAKRKPGRPRKYA